MADDTTEGTDTPTSGAVEGDQNKFSDEGVLHEEMGGEGVEEVGGEHVEGELAESEQVEGEKVMGEGEELMGEELEGEHEEVEGEEKKEETKQEEEHVEEEEEYVEPPPPDPAAPFDFSDSKEALKDPFQLRPDQLAEVEQLWELYQNYTPAYSDLDGFITKKELLYMLKCLILMTYTPEQFEELVAYCVKPSHPEGHITYEQFLKMVTIRQRDTPIEEELRSALQVYDPDHTGNVDREYLKDVLSKQGHKMPQKLLDNFIKEVDMSNDGTIGIEDVVGTLCIDLNKDDLIMLQSALNPDVTEPQDQGEQF